MIVAAKRVSRDVGLAGVVEQIFCITLVFWQVIHSRGNYADGTGHQEVGSTALESMTFHVAHFAMEFPEKPFA